MSDQSQEIAGLHVTVRLLTERIEQLEQAGLAPRPRAGRANRARRATRASSSRAVGLPPRARAAGDARAGGASGRGVGRPSRTPASTASTPPSPPFRWGKLAEQLFAARTLAWAGGVATVLGIVLLFVMAASRGWITPPMRVGIGVPRRDSASLAPPSSLTVAAGARTRFSPRAGAGDRRPVHELWARDIALPLVCPARAPAPLAARDRRDRRRGCAAGEAGAAGAVWVVGRDARAGARQPARDRRRRAFRRRHGRRGAAAPPAPAAGAAVARCGRSASPRRSCCSALSSHPGFGLAVVATAVVAALFVAITFPLELTKTARTSVGWFASVHRRKRIYALARRGVPLRRLPAGSRPLAGRADADRGGARRGADPGRDPVRCAASARQPDRRPRQHLH